MKKWKLPAVALVGVASLTLGGCAGGSDGVSDDTFNVYVAAAVSGPDQLAKNAKTSVLAVQASAQIVNEKDGGIDGRQVRVTVLDDGGDPTIAVSKLWEIAAGKSHPDLYINTGASTIAAATVPILTRNKILSFSMSPTDNGSNPESAPYNFDISPSAATYAAGIAEYVAGEGLQDVGVIHGSSSYGELFGAEMVSALEAVKVKVAQSQEYDTAALDMTAQLQSLKNSGAKALIVDAYGAPLGYLLKSLERLGWEVPLIGNNSIAGTSSIATPAPAGFLGVKEAENVIMQVFQSTSFDADNVLVNNAVATMADLGKIESTLIVAQSFDAIPMVAAAAAKAGNTNLEELVEAIEDPQVQESAETAMVPVPNYSATDHSSSPDSATFTYISPSLLLNGQFGNPAAGGA
ncbi:ABC transporter substrate-binding protein [Tomitella biformata]|uniref:ABC transporter substrate-binding protein n=1 Tax=Tomitella biformata TaxID=630403 RepID=UPI000466FF6D|nr:ABC transporter substrate-binding protein [Tomitella biformata]